MRRRKLQVSTFYRSFCGNNFTTSTCWWRWSKHSRPMMLKNFHSHRENAFLRVKWTWSTSKMSSTQQRLAWCSVGWRKPTSCVNAFHLFMRPRWKAIENVSWGLNWNVWKKIDITLRTQKAVNIVCWAVWIQFMKATSWRKCKWSYARFDDEVVKLFFRKLNGSINELKHSTFVNVEFLSWPIIRYKQEVLFGFVDLLVSFGGIAGLFLGFSLLSAVEIVYYFTMRAGCMFVKNRVNCQSPIVW